MAAEILINVRPSETRVAYVEAGVLLDLKIERRGSPTLVGSVHRGRVLRVLPGMQAAFVDIGLEKAAFLYVGDLRDDYEKFEDLDRDTPFDEEPPPRPPALPKMQIQDLLKEGQYLLVQVSKDPIGTKGARITTHLSLPGRGVVFLPDIKHHGVSRKIEDDEERERLRTLVQKISPNAGVIVRTAGEDATEESLRADIDYLDRLSKEIFKNYEKKKGVGLVHQEPEVELRALRDMMNEDVASVWVDDEEIHKKVSKFVTQLMPKFKQNIVHYTEKKPLFDMYDIDLEISRSMERKIWLKSGGYIVIDEAEALVVIDVNTGRYVGKKDLEDTILKTNLEAAKEISHQIRLRNCGGIIIIDFIDMEKLNHREKVMEELHEQLLRDRAKTNVISMSSLGLVEMTRKRTRPSLVRSLCEPCSFCEGKGYQKRKFTVASEIFRELERDFLDTTGKKANLFVHCHASVVDWIYEAEVDSLADVERRIGRSVTFKVEPNYHSEQFEIFLI